MEKLSLLPASRSCVVEVGAIDAVNPYLLSALVSNVKEKASIVAGSLTNLPVKSAHQNVFLRCITYMNIYAAIISRKCLTRIKIIVIVIAVIYLSKSVNEKEEMLEQNGSY